MRQLTKRDLQENLKLRAYVRENGLENAPIAWRIKTFRDWLSRQPKPEPIQRVHGNTRPSPNVIPEPGLSQIPPGSTFPLFAVLERLGVFVAGAVEQILVANFDPGTIQSASRLITDGFKNTYAHSPNFQELQEARAWAFTKLTKNYFATDVERALSFLYDDLRARLGSESVQESNVKRDYWGRIKQIRKEYNRSKSNGSAADLLERLTPKAYGNDRKKVSDVVRASVGLTAKSTIRLMPNPGERPRFRPANPERQPSFEVIETPDGRTLYKMPDGTTFTTWAAAEQYLAATQNLEAVSPAKVI